MKILSIVGARPQFIKAAPLLSSLSAAGHQSVLLHTGQHYDSNMSQVFFDELAIPTPQYQLTSGSGSATEQLSRMMLGIEPILLKERPDRVVVFGDTNSTLAGALVSANLGVPLSHVEAGLRSYNWTMPEERNRILTDRLAQQLFCPTENAKNCLAKEGITQGVHVVGDTMVDVLEFFKPRAKKQSQILSKLGLTDKSYCLATVHRAHSTDNPDVLKSLFDAFEKAPLPVILPLHPRTRKSLGDKVVFKNTRLVDPVSYLDMLALECSAQVILTDSGGVQKEAFLVQVPCITLRDETEWVETVEQGWNVVAGTKSADILSILKNHVWPKIAPLPIYGDGQSSAKIVSLLTAQ